MDYIRAQQFRRKTLSDSFRAFSSRLQLVLRRRFAWTVHNIVGHPVSEVLWQLGLKKTSSWVHDSTVPNKG